MGKKYLIMKYIAHRGLIEGPDKEIENRPETIQKALDLGLDVEVDVWLIDDIWYLGHDEPQYKTTIDFISKQNLWVHCKNFNSLSVLINRHKNINCFWHENDKYTLTSKGYIWAYPGQETVNERCIKVLPELFSTKINENDCFGICTDYVFKYKKEMNR